MGPPFEIGLYSFAELTPDPATGATQSPAERLRDLLETAQLADEAGLAVFGLGEHHRPEYLASAPAVVLAAVAERTRRLRLSSAVTVLSSDDPVRVFQDFATLDLLSGGRAEIMAGRGSFTESFPLFGHDLRDYDALFEEKLELLLELRRSERVTWSGRFRPPLAGQGVYPRPLQAELPVWVAVGGTPQSVLRAARFGLPVALAIIGGRPARLAPLAEFYRRAGREAGHGPERLRLSLNMHGFVAEDARRAADLFFPPYAQVMNRIGRERGWPAMSRAEFDASCGPEGANLIGSPDELVDKILRQRELFGHDRLLLQLSVGTLPHREVLRAVELLGADVLPKVRRALGSD